VELYRRTWTAAGDGSSILGSSGNSTNNPFGAQTDSHGNITSWLIILDLPLANGDFSVLEATNTTTLGPADASFECVPNACDYGGVTFVGTVFGSNANEPGTWTVSSSGGGGGTNVPEPNSLLLLSSGVLGLIGMRLRKKFV
jgi:hypothetical protein